MEVKNIHNEIMEKMSNQITELREDVDKLKTRVDIEDKKISNLEESDVQQRIQLSQQKIQLSNIEKGQANIEKEIANVMLMITTNSKEEGERFRLQQKTLNLLTQKMMDAVTTNSINDNKTKNNIKFHKTKEFWYAVILITTGISGILGAIAALINR